MKVSSVVAVGAAFIGYASAASSSAAVTSAAQADPACLQFALDHIPSCGLNILTSIGSSAFGCGPLDLSCQCRNSAAISSRAYTPILSACGPSTALDVATAAAYLCDCNSYGASSVPNSVNPYATTAGVNPNANKLCVGYGLAIPACGTKVLQSLAATIGGCQDTDFECQCNNQASVQAVASTPVISACGTTTALLVQSAAAQLCSCITANNQNAYPATGTAATAKATSASSHGLAPQVHYSGGSWLSVFAGLAAFIL